MTHHLSLPIKLSVRACVKECSSMIEEFLQVLSGASDVETQVDRRKTLAVEGRRWCMFSLQMFLN